MAENELKVEEFAKIMGEATKAAVAPMAAEIKELREKSIGAEKIAELETRIKAAEDLAEKKVSAASAQWAAVMDANKSIGGSVVIDQAKATEYVGKIASSIAFALKETGATRLTDKKSAVDYAVKMYPNDKAMHDIMKKDLEAGIPSSGGYTIPQILLPDYIKALYANTILDKVGATKIPLANGNARIARVDTTATVSWGGELPSGAKTQQVLGDAILNAKKLTALVPISNSLLRQSAVGIDSMVSQDLQMKATIALDNAAFNGLGNQYQPLGLVNTPGVIAGSTYTLGVAGTPLALTPQFPMDTLKWLELNNVPMFKPAWVMNPLVKNWLMGKAFSSGPFAWANEMNMSKTLMGMPFISSSTIYSKTDYSEAGIWLADFSEFLWGVTYDISLDVSREGSYTSGGTVYNAFERDETLIRLITEHDFNVRHPVSFAYGIVAKGS